MLKRIPVAALRVGMHVHELCGSWFERPFWRSSFTVRDEDELTRLRDSGVQEVWIDTGRGGDAAGGETGTQVAAQVERELAGEAAAGAAAWEATEDELARAAKVCARSCAAVAELFRQARLGRAIQAESVLPVVDDVDASVQRNPGVLAALARLRQRDDYTYMHSVSVCALMIALARQYGLGTDECREAGLAGLLHDIGKIHIPTDILNKRGPLSEEEFAGVRGHAELGHRLLADSGAGDIVLDVCLHHHEQMAGGGYPHGLDGERISLYARMAAVCDVYDATTSDRPYKSAWQAAHALRKMTEWCRHHFDTRIFHAFVRTVGIYPIGTLVRLKSGHLAVVVDQGAQSLLQPRVKRFYDIAGGRRVPPKLLDLSRAAPADEIVGHEDPAAWGITDLRFLWSGFDS